MQRITSMYRVGYLLTILVIFQYTSFSQGSASSSSDKEDSLEFIEIKKICHIKEHYKKDEHAKYAPHLTGNFIRAYTFSSPDKMIESSVAKSSIETIFTIDLKAYGETGTSEAIGVEAMGGVGGSVELPGVPIKVEYDDELRLYKYSVHLVSKQPYQNNEEKELGAKMRAILSSLIYRLYNFEQRNPDWGLMKYCYDKILYQLMNKEEKKVAKEKERKERENVKPIIDAPIPAKEPTEQSESPGIKKK